MPPTHDATVLAALRSFETILVGGQALPAAITLERAETRGRAHRRAPTARPRRAAAACTTASPCDGVSRADRRRRGADRRPDARRRLPRGSGDDGCRLPAHAATAPAGTARATPGCIEDGVLRVRGRIDNVIVSGRHQHLARSGGARRARRCPGSRSAVVVGVPDERWGEASVVVVPRGEALRRSESMQLEEARAAVAERDRAARAPGAARAGRRARDAPERQARSRGDPSRRRRPALSRQAARRSPVSTTQNRLPSVSSSTTQSASSG